MAIGVDERCHDLARYFLADEKFPDDATRERTVIALSECIQRAVEDWFNENGEPE